MFRFVVDVKRRFDVRLSGCRFKRPFHSLNAAVCFCFVFGGMSSCRFEVRFVLIWIRFVFVCVAVESFRLIIARWICQRTSFCFIFVFCIVDV